MGWRAWQRWPSILPVPQMAAGAVILLLSSVVFAQQPDLGLTLAMNGTATGVAACVACHGMKGEGDMLGGFPRLAGLSSTYLEAQLKAYASGQRQSFLMVAPATLLTPQQRSAVAAYFSQLPPYLPPQPIAIDESAKPSDIGPWLASRGRWRQNLPACAQCHGATGLGVGVAFPALTGQPASYIALQLHQWQEGKRPPGPMGLMSLVAGKLSERDIAAVAAYYGGPNAGIQQAAAGGRK
jgi:cytochrome c553